MILRNTVAGALVIALGGCGVGMGEELVGRYQNPIINGDRPDAPMHEAVVSLHQRSGSSVSRQIFCSGTLISSEVVLTAAHCLVANGKRAMDPSALAIYVGDNPTTGSTPHFYQVVEVLVHPSYDSRQLTDDLGLVRLAAPVTGVQPVPPLPASLGFTAADEGRLMLNFAGFGMDESGAYDQKLQFDGLLTRIQSDTQIYYAQRTGGPCSGDSGGPAFVTRNGTAYVGGVTSYGDYYCTQYGVSTRADAYEQLIADFVGGPAAPDCGADGICEAACASDPDCGGSDPAGCGDGICGPSESPTLCQADCVISHPKRGVMAVCGDGVCSKRETATQCAADCG